MCDQIELLAQIISLLLEDNNISETVLYYDREKLKKLYGLQLQMHNDYITLINKKKSDK